MDRTRPHSRPTGHRRPGRRVVRGVVTAVIGLMSATAGLAIAAPPATGQEDPGVVQARERLQQTQADANAAHDRYQKALDEQDQVQGQITALEQAIPQMRAKEAELRSQLSTRAAALYKNTDPAAGLEVLAAKSHMQAGRRTKLTEAADAFDDERARQLSETALRLEQAQRDLEGKKAQLEELLPRLDLEKAVFDQKVAAANRALQVAEEIGALRALGEPVMGPTVLSAAEMAAWYRSSGASPRLSDGMSIDELAQIYVEEGTAENVRGDFAFAQSYVETGGFRAGGSDNNFSGLGACDGCRGETRFPSARDGIRAQIQHLRAYADATVTVDTLHHPLVDPRFDYVQPKGKAPYWNQFGNGIWAASSTYAASILNLYTRMLNANGMTLG